MSVNWPRYFQREESITDCAESAGIPRERARALATQIASRPLPRETKSRLRAAVHPQLVLAHTHNDPNCSGCPKCCPACRAQLLETPEQSVDELQSRMSQPEFYRLDNISQTATRDQLSALETRLQSAYARWEALEDKTR